MANRNATLYIRITKNGKSSFCKPVYQSKGRLKPQYAMVNGEPEHHKEGVYYVRLGERFTLDYFLKSGVRDGEAAHAEYSDVKGGFLNIVDKPHLKWHPKHWHIRRIPIPQDLIAAIAEWLRLAGCRRRR